MNGLIKIGKLTRLHGIKGALLLQLSGNDRPNLDKTKSFFIEINKMPTPFFVNQIKLSGNNLILSFDSVNSMEAAQKLVGGEVFIEKKNVQKESRPKDLSGYLLHDKNKGELGKVLEILEMPGQRMFSVLINGTEAILPYADDLVTKIDHKSKIIYYNAPDGLIEIYDAKPEI